VCELQRVCPTSIVVTHQFSTVRRTVGRVVFLNEGKVRWDGNVSDIDHSIGCLLHFYLPTGAHEHVVFGPSWKYRHRLRHAYKGSMGRRIGCDPEHITFGHWLRQVEHGERQFQLIAMEYTSPTARLISKLGLICSHSDSPAIMALNLVGAWDVSIRTTH
jgi:energy-coupling factor transporter ATP-binding protein EcfA2